MMPLPGYASSPEPTRLPPPTRPGPSGDILHVAAAVLGSRILRQAADAYDRAARAPYGRIPRPSPAGNSLRQAARLISAFAFVSGDRSLSQIALITRLAALAEAVCVLRQSQQRAAQAARRAQRSPAAQRRRRNPRYARPQRTCPCPQRGTGGDRLPAGATTASGGLPRPRRAKTGAAGPQAIAPPRPVTATAQIRQKEMHDGPVRPLPRPVR